jgi:hypothetical protein
VLATTEKFEGNTAMGGEMAEKLETETTTTTTDTRQVNSKKGLKVVEMPDR